MAVIQWSSRVPAAQVRRLYEGDARGLLDDELLDDVGHGIYVRCQDILTISQAQRGKVKCPCCENIILRRKSNRSTTRSSVHTFRWETELLRCRLCNWQITGRNTYKVPR